MKHTLTLLAALLLAPLVDAHFGPALDTQQATLTLPGNDAYAQAPLTVECWVNLRSKDDWNVIVANEAKESGTHWEIYSYANSGVFSVYLPGCVPSTICSDKIITDGQWHYLAFVFDGQTARLCVDAKEVANRPVKRTPAKARQPGPLTIGFTQYTGGTIGCDGLVDEVRISKSVRPIAQIPAARLASDDDTVTLWHLDAAPAGAKLQPFERVSLDEKDRESYHAGPAPLDSEAVSVALRSGAARHPSGPVRVSLNGLWQMAATEDFRDEIPATVPGSIHSALCAASKIPDPKFGRNDAIAHEQSFKTWWLRRTFPRPSGASGERLVFDGVAIHCTVWLNGTKLGEHEGMFGGPEFDVADKLQDQNTLVVKIDPAPGDPKAWNNGAWKQTVVFNNVWGWHYSSIPALGIWRSVRLEAAPAARIDHPFVATRDAAAGVVDLVAQISGGPGKLIGTIEPENFSGSSYHFVQPAKPGMVHLRFQIPQPRLWWPNDLGAPNLYRLKLSFVPDGRGVPDFQETTFGVRTIAMAPLPGRPRANRYNWQFVVNGRSIFVKGSGWCTMDSSMDFSRARYDRFLLLAKLQHVQMLRGWGSGMPETDDFYDLCDRSGIMVLQEWPTAWNSHTAQPYDVLEETVRRNTLRLRNHPSLAMWGGGNESSVPVGKAIDMMGRYAMELDGTRVFHRAEPWGGSAHNYDCYWGRQPLDHNLNMVAPFFGEFGLACMPELESVLRYLPANETTTWPAPPDGSLVHHTPIFGTADDWSRLGQYSGYFVAPTNLATFILGSQLSQAVGVRHTLERARTRWPDCAGALYYKMNDNYPAASWSCVDWYGAPKMSHYFFQQAFAPLHACVLFTSVNNRGQPLSLPVFLLDDADALRQAAWEVRVRAFDAKLQLIREESYQGRASIERVKKLGEFTLSAAQTDTTPLLVVTEVRKNGTLADRTFYFTNYEAAKGCLFRLPSTQLSLRAAGDQVVVRNTRNLPAVAVQVLRPGHLDTFTAAENYFWLDAGESKTIGVNSTDGLTVGSWNSNESAQQNR